MSLPEVSVIIPTYNGSRFIADALRSVFAQTYLPCEIIVVDDCSTDDTLEVVEGLKAESPVPLQVVRMDRNFGGPAKPLNSGIDAAHGPLIAILEQDDRMLPERLALQANALHIHSEASVCMGGVVQTDVSRHGGAGSQRHVELPGEIAVLAAESREGVCIVPEKTAFRLLLQANFFYSNSNLMFQRKTWREVGGYDQRWPINADAAFEFALLCKGPVVLVNQPTCVYFHRADSLYHGQLSRAQVDGQLIRLEWAVRRPLWAGSEIQPVYWRLRSRASEALKSGRIDVASRLWWAIIRSGVVWLHLSGWPHGSKEAAKSLQKSG